MDENTGSGISGISLVSYDWKLLFRSIPSYIDYVDELILGLDINRKTWSGSSFELPDDWSKQLASMDPLCKIKIVEDDFCIEGLTPFENDTRERNILSMVCQKDNWLVSVDADEQFVNADEFFRFLQTADSDSCIFGRWALVYRRIGAENLVVSANRNGLLEIFPVATKKQGAFKRCRYTDDRQVISPLIALHYSWSRSESELLTKLRSWGHSHEIDTRRYFEFWKSVDLTNYKTVRDFHPISPDTWYQLKRLSDQQLARLQSSDLLPQESVWIRLYRLIKSCFRVLGC